MKEGTGGKVSASGRMGGKDECEWEDEREG